MSSTDPVDLIFTGLRIKRSKPKIKEKLLELGLAQDRKELRKKRTRKSNQGEYTYSFFLPHHGLKHPLFRPIPSHFIRICLSYYPPIPRLFPFDQSSSNAIAGDCIERLAFNDGSETTWKWKERAGGSEKEQRSICTGFFSLSCPDFFGSEVGMEKTFRRYYQ